MRLKRLFHSPSNIASLVIVVTIVIATTVAAYLFNLIQDEVRSSLVATLDSSLRQAKQELRNIEKTTSYWAANPNVRHFAEAIQNKQMVLPHLLTSVDIALTSIIDIENYRDYKILNRNGKILLSGVSSTDKSAPLTIPPKLLTTAWQGKTVLTPPFHANQPWRDDQGHVLDHLPTMMAIAPIRNDSGEVIALFAFEFDPDRVFIPAFLNNQVGKTGETYAIDKTGRLLTESKFDKQLVALGLLNHNYPHSALNIRVVDPGKRLEKSSKHISDEAKPLTTMAQSLTQGHSGINLRGYRDYRGVPVIGAWKWDKALGMGIVTETEVAEVYQIYRTILYGILLSIIVVIVMTLIAARYYRRFNDQQLATLQQRDAIINQTDDGFVTIDYKGIITMVNPAICRLFGYKNEELLGQNVSILLPEDERTAHDKYLAESHLHSERIIHQTRNLYAQRKNGSKMQIELIVTPMNFGEGKFFIGVIRDISERIQYQQKLIAAKESAEKANQAKSEFLTKMSHELRTPLNAIIGFSQLLSQEMQDDSQRDSAEMIHSSGQHLLTLINDVLDLARIESGRMTVSVKQVDVAELIHTLQPLVEMELTNHDVTLNIMIPTSTPVWVKADHLKLKQVLLNLVTNAIKYNRPGGQINIQLIKNTGKVRIVVEDTGYGIAPALRTAIFEPFNRLDKENTAIQGTGIGLAISHELVNMMGGVLDFSSVSGQGATFWVELPESDMPEVSNNYNEKEK